MKLLSIIVPCYNEEEVLNLFYEKITNVIENISYDYEIIFIDDGSTDNTSSIIKKFNEINPKVSLISFSRNFGKESGIYAGLTASKGDLVVVMDADLQHNPNVIPKMIDYIEQGYDTVYTKRVNRIEDSVFKKFFSNIFYTIMQKITDINIIQGAQDFRMMKRLVVDSILNLKEYNRFSKGIFAWVGFKSTFIEVEDEYRAAGITKWNFFSLFRYAVQGIVAFSSKPLRISIFIGGLVSLISFILIIITLVEVLMFGVKTAGYPSIILAISFIGGMQIFLIGILSEYVAKIYEEVKARPKYIVREYIESNKER